jgi:hypothetical protein
MSSQSSGDHQSDLWISLDDAVKGTGVSKRSIQDWVRTGEVKREKRKGKVFLWVADLTALTPLTRAVPEVEPEELAQGPEVLLPEAVDSYVAGASMKAVGERLKENRQLQEKILSRLDEVGGAIELVQKNAMEPKDPQLDERTVKELSLLGNVFRSIHQQNEKVSKALEGQELLLKNLESGLDREASWSDRWVKGEQKVARWKIVSICLLMGAMTLGLFFWREIEGMVRSHEDELKQVEEQKRALLTDVELAEKKVILTKKESEKEVSSLVDQHSKAFDQERSMNLSKVKALKLELQALELEKARALRNKDIEKERLLTELKAMSVSERERLEKRYQQELKKVEAREQSLLELTSKIGAMQTTLEKTILEKTMSSANHHEHHEQPSLLESLMEPSPKN